MLKFPPIVVDEQEFLPIFWKESASLKRPVSNPVNPVPAGFENSQSGAPLNKVTLRLVLLQSSNSVTMLF